MRHIKGFNESQETKLSDLEVKERFKDKVNIKMIDFIVYLLTKYSDKGIRTSLMVEAYKKNDVNTIIIFRDDKWRPATFWKKLFTYKYIKYSVSLSLDNDLSNHEEKYKNLSNELLEIREIIMSKFPEMVYTKISGSTSFDYNKPIPKFMCCHFGIKDKTMP